MSGADQKSSVRKKADAKKPKPAGSGRSSSRRDPPPPPPPPPEKSQTGDEDGDEEEGTDSENESPFAKLLQGGGNGSIRLIMFPVGDKRRRADTDPEYESEGEGDDDEETNEDPLNVPLPMPAVKRPRTSPHPMLAELTPEESKAWNGLNKERKEELVNACKRLEGRSPGGDCRLPPRFRILLSAMPESAKRLAMQRMQAISKMPPFGSDGPKQQAWLDKLLDIPFGRYMEPPLEQGPRELLANLQRQMDKSVYGMPSVKKSILQAMAQWISSPQSKGLVLGIQGPPGVGKTSLVRGIAATLGRPFVSLNMGGFRDSAGLLGHEMTYVGSTNGALSDALIQSGCMNPVILMDEIDKISRSGAHGDEITGVLVHLTDETQNHEFQDRYFGASVPLDFSRSTMVFTFNDESAIDPILHNRMVIVRVPSLTRKEKVHIAKEYLWPTLQKELGVDGAILTEEAVEALMEEASVQEPGVRMLKSRLRQLLQAHQMANLLDEEVPWAKAPWTCARKHVKEILAGVSGEALASAAPPFGMYM